MELNPISENVEVSFKKVLGDLTAKYYPEPTQKKKSAHEKKLDKYEHLLMSDKPSDRIDFIFKMEGRDLSSKKKKSTKKRK